MSVSVPNALALGTIADGSLMIASDERNNFTAVQVGVNGLIAMFTNAPTKGDLIVSAGAGAFDKLGVGSNGQVVTADSTQALGVKWASSAQSELNYVEPAAASFTVTTASTEVSPLSIITSGSVTYDGSPVVIEFFTPLIETGISGAQLGISLWDNTAGAEVGILGLFQLVGGSASQQLFTSARLSRRITPAAGARVYSIRAWAVSNSGVITGLNGGGNYLPAYMRITKV